MVKDNATFGLASLSRAPFVGRVHELEKLGTALQDVEKRRETRVVTVVGSQGVGKSRLALEFLFGGKAQSALASRVYRGSAREKDAAYGPFARMLRMRFGLTEGMSPDEVKSVVRTQVAQATGDRKVGDIVYFLGQLLEIPFEESPLTRAVADDPAEGRLLRRAIFKSFIEADASHSPLCLVFDDLHAAHQDALALLRYLIEYVSAPVLIVCIARPELLAVAEDWITPGQSERHTLIELGALNEDDAKELMRSMLAPCAQDEASPKSVPQTLIDYACSYGAGNPSLLEQMVRLYHDRGVLEEKSTAGSDARWSVHLDKLEKAELPLTVLDAIGARLSALSPFERKVLELAATMGGVFWSAGLIPLLRAGKEAPELWSADEGSEGENVSRALADLARRDYVLKLPDSSLPGSDEYVFKHNLEREAVTASTTPTALKRGHAVFADWLDRQSHTRSGEQTIVLLAEHREKAGDMIGAGLAYLEAGDAARSSYAADAACAHYERGLELLGERAVVRRIDALHNHGDVLALAGRIEDALMSFREMLTLAYRLDMKSKGGAAHNRIGRLYRETGALDEAQQHLEAAMALFISAGDERGVASSIDDIGKLQWLKGEYQAALSTLKDALGRRRRLGDRRSIALSLNNLGIVLQETGEFGQAIEAWEQALGIRREVGDLVGVVATLNNLGTLLLDRADFVRALPTFEDALEVARQIGDRNRIALVLVNIGDTLHRSGKSAEAIEILSKAEEQFDEVGDKLGLADALRALGEAHLASGDLVKARECIGRCVDIFATVKSRVQLGVALRTLGEITAAGGWGATHTKSAREYFARSATIFEQTGNAIELAKTFTAFAKFLRKEEDFVKDDAAQLDARRMETMAQTILARLQRGHDLKPRAPSQEPRDPE